MPDTELAAVLRAILNELCVSIPAKDNHTRADVAAALLAAAQDGPASIDELREAGKTALPGRSRQTT